MPSTRNFPPRIDSSRPGSVALSDLQNVGGLILDVGPPGFEPGTRDYETGAGNRAARVINGPATPVHALAIRVLALDRGSRCRASNGRDRSHRLHHQCCCRPAPSFPLRFGRRSPAKAAPRLGHRRRYRRHITEAD